jgi:hypothetical protein
MDTLYQHIVKHHNSDPQWPKKGRLDDYCCNYQTLFLEKYRHFFRVQTGLVDLHTSSPYSVFLGTVNLTLPANIQPKEIKDDKVPSFLQGTHWLTFMEPYCTNPKDVVALVEYLASAAEEMEKVLGRLGNVSDA